MKDLLHWMNQLKAVGERRLCIVEGSQQQGFEQLQTFFPQEGLWLGDGPKHCLPQAMNHTMSWLGQEYPLIVINGYSGLNPEILGAVCGALQAGGFLFLLMPPRENWRIFADPDYQRYVALPELAKLCHPHFLLRMRRVLEANSSVYWWSAETGECHSDNNPRNHTPWSLVADDRGCLSSDQRQAFEHLQKLPNLKQPMVLIADRGRGKSTLMGLAAKQWVAQGYRVVLTAPSMQTAKTVFKHAGEIPFVSPEVLVTGLDAVDIVLVDEAAAIPADWLRQIQQRYHRVVYATTVHGYEGSGHGFELRMCRWLQSVYPNMQILTLSTPLRWSETDPVEPLLSRLLLLDAEIQAPQITDTCQLTMLRSEDLLLQEVLLQQVVGLLVLAHYQTSPTDVRLLLDSPDIQIGLWRSQEQLVGVVLLTDEGPIEPSLATQICAGTRRPRGQLLPQTLLAHCGYEAAAQYRYLRVMRIAIHPNVQGLGLGSQLMKAIEQTVASQTDFLGTSFSATSELIDFWSSLGWQPVRIGLSKDTATGGHAVVFLQSCNEPESILLNQWNRYFQLDLPDWLAFQLNELPPSIVTGLYRETDTIEILSVRACQDLHWVSDHHRSLDHALPAIRQLMQQRTAFLQLDKSEQEWMIARFWQGRSWEWLCQHYGFSGQKSAVKAFRVLIKKLLSLAHSREQKITANWSERNEN